MRSFRALILITSFSICSFLSYLLGDRTHLGLHACRVEFNTQELDSTDTNLGEEQQQTAQRLRDAVAFIFSVSGRLLNTGNYICAHRLLL